MAAPNERETCVRYSRAKVAGLIAAALLVSTMPAWRIEVAFLVMAVLGAAASIVLLVAFIRLFDAPAYFRMRREMRARIREIRQRPPRTSDELIDLFEAEVRR